MSRVSGVEHNALASGKPYAVLVLLQLHWFIRLRWMFAATGASLLLLERVLQPDARRPLELWMVVAGVAAVNVIWTLFSRLLRRRLERPEASERASVRSGQLFTSAQITIDLLLLTWILALTGGVENPMSLFYLFHMAISGLLLRTWQAMIQAVWAIGLYGAMALCQYQGAIPFYPFLPTLSSAGSLFQVPEFVGINVTITAFAIAGTVYFMDRIGKVLDRREARLIEMNTALQKSERAIRDLQRRRSRFMQTAAHQLKSPLAMVQTFANLIRDGLITDEESVRAACDKIVRRARDGIAQVSELLALARVQEADPRRHQESLASVTQIVEELCRKQAPVANEKSIDLTWDLPRDAELQVRVHAADLTDCLGNLIENAIKYTPDRGSVRVVARAGVDGHGHDSVIVSVEDTGMGIEEDVLLVPSGEEAQESLFDAFRRGRAALEAGIPGTGLGLSIVREVVEQAGGSIQVQSTPGQGSTFTISFPMATGPVTPGGAAHPARTSRIVVKREA